MPIETTRDEDRNLTIQAAVGRVLEAEILAALDAFYAGTPTMLVLWDLSDGDLSTFTPETIRNIVTYVSKLGRVRDGGRTAIAAPQDLQFGFGRMVEAISEVTSVPFSMRVFRSKSEALLWLIAGEELKRDAD